MLTRTLLRLGAAGAVAAAASALPLAAQAGGTATVLQAQVGKGWSITLTDARGGKVKELKPGAYAIKVSDTTDIHNFHLTGPGVDEDTGVKAKLQTTWKVTLKPGKYTYVCDPHRTIMKGSFEVK